MGPKTRADKNLTKLNEKVETMADNFSKQMITFKNSIGDLPSSSGSTSQEEHFHKILEEFSEFEKTINQQLNDLKEEIGKISSQVCDNQRFLENVQRKQNRNKLLIHGLKVGNDSLLSEIIRLLSSQLSINITPDNINACYRISKSDNTSKPAPVCVEFVHQWKRDEVFNKKKKFKGSKILISEVLTPNILGLFKLCRAKFNKDCWTSGGVIIVVINNERLVVRSNLDFEKLLSS